MVFILTSLINKIKNGRAIAICKWTIGKLCHGRYRHNKAITADMSVAALSHVGDSHWPMLCTEQQYLLVLQTVFAFFLNTQKRQEQFTILLCFQTRSTQKRCSVANLPFCFVFKQVRETMPSKLTVLLCFQTGKRDNA